VEIEPWSSLVSLMERSGSLMDSFDNEHLCSDFKSLIASSFFYRTTNVLFILKGIVGITKFLVILAATLEQH
jgi:hypothetical protein